MSLVLQVLGRSRLQSNPTTQGQWRKRLQKLHRGTEFYACKEFLDNISAQSNSVQSCLTIFSDDDDDAGTRVLTLEETRKPTSPQPRGKYLVEGKLETKSICSDISFSIYSLDEMMDAEILTRTRAKTPCFWVGQLDEYPRDSGGDFANSLAVEYQALLPPRVFTPTPETLIFGKTVRKVKGQQSLRDLVEKEKEQPRFSIQSDCDTLVGSESPPSPLTPNSGHCHHEKSQIFDFEFGFGVSPISRDPSEGSRKSNASSTQGNDVGFQLCLDMLTEQLATGLFKKHPTEKLDRASSLQILLMIEAYESVQQQLRQEKSDSQNTWSESDHVREIEQTLDHWLRALYSIYERIGLNNSVESFRSCKTSVSSSQSEPSPALEEESRDDSGEAQRIEAQRLATDAQEQWKLRRKLRKVQKKEGSWWTRHLGD